MTTERLKVSRYNHFFAIEEENRHFVYNAFSNGLAQVEPWLYEKLSAGSVTSADMEDPAHATLWEDLKKGSILIDKEMDELGAVRFMFQLGKFDSNALGLTIVTTHACNLDCSYCYEHTNPVDTGLVTLDRDNAISEEELAAGSTPGGTMLTEADESAILEFVHKQKDAHNYRSLNVAWYGGEPLLNLPRIESLSQKLIAFCDEVKMAYHASLITNGTRFTKDVAERLKSLRVGFVQITIDGPKEIHDRRRPYKGTPTGSSFDSIMANIAAVYGLIPIAVRINIDKANTDHVAQLIAEFKDRNLLDDPQKLNVYLGNTQVACNNLTGNEFASAVLELDKQLDRRGLKGAIRYPQLNSYCGAVALHSYVIEPGGVYQKCWETVGKKDEYLGRIDGPIMLGLKALNWLRYDAIDWSAECGECGFFPICGGGCPYFRMKRPELLVTDPDYYCTTWKLFLRERLIDFIRAQMHSIKAIEQTDNGGDGSSVVTPAAQ